MAVISKRPKYPWTFATLAFQDALLSAQGQLRRAELDDYIGIRSILPPSASFTPLPSPASLWLSSVKPPHYSLLDPSNIASKSNLPLDHWDLQHVSPSENTHQLLLLHTYTPKTPPNSWFIMLSSWLTVLLHPLASLPTLSTANVFFLARRIVVWPSGTVAATTPLNSASIPNWILLESQFCFCSQPPLQ